MSAGFGMPGIAELLIIGVVLVVGVPLIALVAVVAANRGQQQTAECPKCGAISPRSNFCPHCGAGPMKED